MTTGGTTAIVTIPTLVNAFNILLEALHLDTDLYSLHSLRWGGVTTAYHGSTDQIDIKRHWLWSSDAFWLYVAASPVAASLAAAMN